MEDKSQENQLFSFLNVGSGRARDGIGGGAGRDEAVGSGGEAGQEGGDRGERGVGGVGGGGRGGEGGGRVGAEMRIGRAEGGQRGEGGGVGGGEMRIGGAGGAEGGGKAMRAKEETMAEADSTFDANITSSNRRHHSLSRKPQLNIRDLHSTSGDDLRRHQTRDRKFPIANRRASSYSGQREEEKNEKEEKGRSEARIKKMLLREWLMKQADDEAILGLRWIEKEDGGGGGGQVLLRIPWVHESKASWTPDDSRVFEEWAKYTGKFWSSTKDHKRWKSNFRCAINSLPDVEEVRSRGRKSGLDTFKVYRFLPEQPRNQHRSTPEVVEKRRRRRTIDDGTIDEGTISRRTITFPSSPFSSSSSSSLSLSQSQIMKKEDLCTEDKKFDEIKSSSSASILPAISTTSATYQPQTMPFINNPSFSSSLSFLAASSSLSDVSIFSSFSSSTSASFVSPSIHPMKEEEEDDEESPHHHGDDTTTPYYLVPTTVAAMSVDSDDDDDDDDEDNGGRNGKSSAIGTHLNTTMKEESCSSSSSTCSSNADSSYSFSDFESSLSLSSVAPLPFLHSSGLHSSVRPSSSSILTLPFPSSSSLPSSGLHSSVPSSSTLPSSVRPSSVLTLSFPSSSFLPSSVPSLSFPPSSVCSSSVLPSSVLPLSIPSSFFHPSSVCSSSVLPLSVPSSFVLPSSYLPLSVLPSPFDTGLMEIDAMDLDEVLQSL